MNKISKEALVFIGRCYEDFRRVIERISTQIFKFEYPDFIKEEVEGFEIIEDQVYATLGYIKDNDFYQLTVEFPLSYLTDDNWEAKAKQKAEEIRIQRKAAIMQSEKESQVD